MRLELDPAWRIEVPLDAARAWAAGRGRGFNPHALQGTFRLTIDGVDLAAGRAHGEVIPMLEALLAQARTLAGEGRAAEVVLGSAGGLALSWDGDRLAVSVAGRTVQAEVTPGAWLRAVRSTAATFLDDLETLAPGARASRPCRNLSRRMDHGTLPAVPEATATALEDHPTQEDPPPAPPSARTESPVEPAPAASDPVAKLPGNLRRVHFERTFRFDATGTRLHLEPVDGDLLVATRRQVERRSASGGILWAAPLHDARVAPGVRPVVVGRESTGLLAWRDLDGRKVGRAALPGWDGRVRGAVATPEALVVAAEAEVAGLGGDGAVLWRAPLPGGFAGALGLGDGLITWTADGTVTRFAATGGPAWRSAGNLANVTGLRATPTGDVLVVGVAESREANAVLLEGRSGRVAARLTLGLVRPTPPVAFGQGVAVGGEAPSGARVIALPWDLSEPLWAAAPPHDGHPGLACEEPNLLVARAGGGVVALSAHGRIRWVAPPADPDPLLGPSVPPPPLATGGLVIARGAHLHVLDATTGRRVARLDPPELAPPHVVVLPGPVVVVSGEDGRPVDGFRLRGLLRVA